MGKRLFMLFTAIFMIALTSNAQENSYSMVIEMANGTKINIGPNDIKNLSFIDGKLALQGESIDDIKKEVANLNAIINAIQMPDLTSIYAVIADLKAQIYALQSQVSSSKKEIADLQSQVSSSKKEIADLQAYVANLTMELAALKEQVEKNNNNNNGQDDGNYLAKVAGTWVQKYGERGTIGIKLTADGKAYYNEWDISEQPNFNNVVSPASVTVTATTLRITHPQVAGYYEEYSYQLSSDGKSITFTLLDWAKDKHSLSGTFTKLSD